MVQDVVCGCRVMFASWCCRAFLLLSLVDVEGKRREKSGAVNKSTRVYINIADANLFYMMYRAERALG